MALEDISSLEELQTAINDYLKTPKRPGLTGAELNTLLKKVIEFAPGTSGAGLPEGGTNGQTVQYNSDGEGIAVNVPSLVQAAFEAADAQIVDGASSSYNTLSKIATKLIAVEAIIADGGSDGDSIVNTVAELLAVFETYPEGTDIATVLAGKINTSDIVNNLTQVVTGKVLDAAQGKVLKDLIDALTIVVAANTTHAGNTSNPHSVTKSQVGLANVDNTADTAKPVSAAQLAALDLKNDIQIANTTGTTVLFTVDKIYGSKATPETGNITLDVTGAKLGVSCLVIHNHATTAPLFGTNSKKATGSGDYVPGLINYIQYRYIATDELQYSIYQTV